MELTYHDEFLPFLLEEAEGTINKCLRADSGPETVLLIYSEPLSVWGLFDVSMFHVAYP